MTNQTAEHYGRVAATYDEHWTYSPDYVQRFSQAMIDALRLARSDTIADIGCGTGLYTRRIARDVEPTRPILCVDPVPAMLDRLPPHPRCGPCSRAPRTSPPDASRYRTAPRWTRSS